MPNQSKPKTDSKSSQPKTIEEALARFQMEHHAAGKDGKANYGTYTTLAGGLNAVQPATHLGLSHTQTFEHIVVGEKVVTVLKTRLLFTGEDSDYNTVIESNLPFPDLVPNRGNIMQALGSAITYARRYSLLAIYGLAGDDDDGEGSAPVAAKKEIARSPQRGSNSRQVKASPAAHEMVTGKVAQDPYPASTKIPQSQKAALSKELDRLPFVAKNKVISTFRQQFNISSEKISEFITTPEHLSFIKSKIAEVESDSP